MVKCICGLYEAFQSLLMAELCTAPSSLHAKHLTYDCVKGGGAYMRAEVPFLPLFKTPLIYRQP